ncbi:YlbE-like family protein [Pullulanibacillus sp. KACC 23026]|uniref:YlbE-like family protein n=1 Tax=Pullulanibacillus sp. KACC 23026 TaxID=3028315 RepID=UPI0023B1E327|nr:YlbE-like family protein [Pullulanibacillus sp. KACC 23026]WEG11688.1 YlbE-like family protein [Pullulanibacillus sp. KACC 23026]
MRREVIYRLDQDPELKQFIRLHPIWYKKLARQPHLLSEMESQANDFYGKSFSKRIERISQGLGMINMMLELASMQNEENS